jgi:centromeric protein E
MSDGDGSEEAVRVFVRIRPLNKRELAEKQTIGWNFNETSMLEDTPNGQRVYAFDHCFTPASTNQETYDIIGKPVVLKAMEGYNGTVFTYGQTGSGKTWTMRGSESEPGMMVLCIRDILEWIRSHPDIQYKIRVAYLEVYNEEINDLLGETGMTSKNLKIVSEDVIRGAVIGGLVEEDASTSEQFMEILRRGEQSRSYASTNMNAESSRSHTIYRITIEAKGGASGHLNENQDDDDSVMGGAGAGGSSSSAGRVSYLNLVDLAGSERQKSTKAEGKVLKEGANINKSLLALGAVIKKLGEVSKVKKGADKSSSFIPYRDSKLTRILKQSLGGNALTSILCTVTPAPMHREETVSTLKFGQLCKSIKNTVKANDGLMDDKALLKQYRQNIAV